MTDLTIETRGLTCYFGRTAAVRELSIAVPRGCVFGFLGRNGSGKTTTIRMLLDVIEPTRGSSSVLGQDSRTLSPEVRARIGYMSEGHPVYGWMRVGEAETFQSGFYRHWNRELFASVIDHFGLQRKAKAKHLSRGQRAGLCLALTLAPEPELLILDDPALGLDPVARRSLLEAMIYFTRREGRTILFSSHMLSDVERVADCIAVIDRGVLRANCSLDTFREKVRQVALYHAGASPELPEIPGLLSAARSDGQVTLTIANYGAATRNLLESIDVERIEEVPIGLEEAFIGYLGDRGERSFFLADSGGEP